MAYITIRSRLPVGLLLELPSDPSKTVEIKGVNSSNIIGAEHYDTPVDSAFWEAVVKANPEFPPIQNKSIFVVSNNAADAAAKTLDASAQETGLEPLRQDGKDKRAAGVKKAKEE